MPPWWRLRGTPLPEIIHHQWSAREILERAANELDRSGWCQRISRNTAGQMCAEYALSYVCGEPFVHQLHYQRARWMLLGHIGFPRLVSSLTRWNDAPGRTKEEVTAAMREAARRD